MRFCWGGVFSVVLREYIHTINVLKVNKKIKKKNKKIFKKFKKYMQIIIKKTKLIKIKKQQIHKSKVS